MTARPSRGDSRRARRLARVSTPTLVAFLAILYGGVVSGEAPVDLALPDNPVHGRILFESRHCNQCHGLGNQGHGVGPDLGEGGFAGSFLDLGAALWNHVPGMSVRVAEAELVWPHLSASETVELTAFLYFIEYLGTPGNAALGREIFEKRGCSACHSIDGDGDAVGPELGQLERFASPLYIAQAIWNHGPSMLESMRAMKTNPPRFEEGDLAHLSAFLRQTAAPNPQENVMLTPGNPNRGRDVFQAKNCSTCHAVQGRGGRGGPDLSDSDLHRSAEAIAGIMWNHALAMQASMRERGVAWPRFTTVELADLIAFLYFLPFTDQPGDAAHGEEVFASRSCATCHAEAQNSGHPGPDLAGTTVASSAGGLVAAMWNHAPVMKEAILSEGRPWPELSGQELRDLLAYLAQSDTN